MAGDTQVGQGQGPEEERLVRLSMPTEPNIVPSNTAAQFGRMPPTATQLEAAAREYCRLSNMDAEALVRLQQPIPGANGPIDKLPKWRFIGSAIQDQWRLNEAMRVGFALDNLPQST